MGLSQQTLRAVRRYGPRVDGLARSRYGISGEALLAKLVLGESGDRAGAVSSAGARGKTQFTSGSRRIAVQRFGVDPWRSTDEAVHAAVLHLKGKINGSKGLEGYNPGDPNYPKYILGQKVGKIGGSRGAVEGGSTRGQLMPESVVPELPGGSRGILDLVSGLAQRPQVQVSAPAAPAFSATASLKLPGGYQPVPSAPVAPRPRIGDALQALVQQGDLGLSPTVTGGGVTNRGPGGSTTQTGNALVASVKAEADRIDQAKVPYAWGGGHGKPQKAGSKVTPLDCSGAVSRVLGINPRVSGEFVKWGKPGRGAVTVYANRTHVLMEINGHFWGTSRSNPGGGPGWIPRGQISRAYLSKFTARHA